MKIQLIFSEAFLKLKSKFKKENPAKSYFQDQQDASLPIAPAPSPNQAFTPQDEIGSPLQASYPTQNQAFTQNFQEPQGIPQATMPQAAPTFPDQQGMPQTAPATQEQQEMIQVTASLRTVSPEDVLATLMEKQKRRGFFSSPILTAVLLVAIAIVALLLLWIGVGVLMKEGVLTHVDLGYEWFLGALQGMGL